MIELCDKPALPRVRNDPRPADLAIGGYQGHALDGRGGADYAIGGVVRERGWKSHRPGADTGGDWQDDETGLDFHQETFEADTKAYTALAGQRSELQEGDSGNRKALIVPASRVDRRFRSFGNSARSEGQPEHDVRVQQDQESFPHSFDESAGDTTSPVIAPFPARKL